MMLGQCLIVFIIVLIIVEKFRRKKSSKIHKQYKTNWMSLPFIGNALHVIGNNEDLFRSYVDLTSQSYKNKHGIIGVDLGIKYIIVLSDPIQALAVLKAALNKTLIHRFISHLLGDSVIFTSVEIWQRKRKILAPIFAPRYVTRFISIFEGNAKIAAELLESQSNRGNMSLWNYISPFSLDSVCETILDVKMGVLRKPNHEFFEAFHDYFEILSRRVCKPWLYIEPLYRLLSVYKEQVKTRDTMYQFVDNVIRKKRESIKAAKDKPNDNGRDFKTFLELMIESSEENDKAYTDEELRDEALGLVLAATDTSATAASFVFVLLSQHQDVQDKVYKEIVDVFGNTDKSLEYADLKKLTYMEAVIKETLRLYPSIPVITRDTSQEYTLPAGLTVPSNYPVVIGIHAIHHNPHYWGDDADCFKPERFVTNPNPTPGTFMAFSHGIRKCPGQLYAMLSIKTILTTVLRRCRLLPATSFKYDENTPLRLSFEIMIKHVDNFEVQIEKRI